MAQVAAMCTCYTFCEYLFPRQVEVLLSAGTSIAKSERRVDGMHQQQVFWPASQSASQPASLLSLSVLAAAVEVVVVESQ